MSWFTQDASIEIPNPQKTPPHSLFLFSVEPGEGARSMFVGSEGS